MGEEAKPGAGAAGSAPEENVSVTLLVVRQLDRIDARFDRLEQRVDRLETRFDSELGQVRSELGQVRGEVGQLRQEMGTLVRWSISTVVAVLVGAGAVVITLLTRHP